MQRFVMARGFEGRKLAVGGGHEGRGVSVNLSAEIYLLALAYVRGYL
jgi:hypothetical protein